MYIIFCNKVDHSPELRAKDEILARYVGIAQETLGGDFSVRGNRDFYNVVATNMEHDARFTISLWSQPTRISVSHESVYEEAVKLARALEAKGELEVTVEKGYY